MSFSSTLQSLFNTLVQTALSKEDKQLRNDVIMIVSLLAANSTKAPFVVQYDTINATYIYTCTCTF